MNYINLPSVVKEIVFRSYVKIIGNPYDFFEELMKTRQISREFKHRVDKILKKFFTCQNIYFYRDLTSLRDTKSVFLKDRLDKHYKKHSFILFEKDLNHRLICSNCSVILDNECFFA